MIWPVIWVCTCFTVSICRSFDSFCIRSSSSRFNSPTYNNSSLWADTVHSCDFSISFDSTLCYSDIISSFSSKLFCNSVLFYSCNTRMFSISVFFSWSFSPSKPSLFFKMVFSSVKAAIYCSNPCLSRKCSYLSESSCTVWLSRILSSSTCICLTMISFRSSSWSWSFCCGSIWGSPRLIYLRSRV